MLANVMEREAFREASGESVFLCYKKESSIIRKEVFHYHTFVHLLLQFYTALTAAAGVQPRWIQGIRRVDGVGVERLVY